MTEIEENMRELFFAPDFIFAPTFVPSMPIYMTSQINNHFKVKSVHQTHAHCRNTNKYPGFLKSNSSSWDEMRWETSHLVKNYKCLVYQIYFKRKTF